MTRDTAETKAKVTELALTKMDYSGAVEGAIANLQLKLAYENKLAKPIEPVFTFPLPPEATVLGVTLKVGDRIIQSELKRAEDARRDYDQAVAAGHQASLLEQHRDNIFSMSVGGIQPGETVDVVVNYMHPVDWQSGGGRFIVPMVVAPHFVHGNPLERSHGLGFSPDTDKVPDASRITPHVASNPDQITYRASLDLTIDPGFKARISSPSHDAIFEETTVDAHQSARVLLNDLRPDRDLTLVYRAEERVPQVKVDKTLWASEAGESEHFTLVQIMPSGTSQAKKREVVMVLDCSGSMQGLPIAGLRSVTEKTIEQLKASGDEIKLAVIKFDDSPTVLSSMRPLDERVDVKKIIAELEAGGGTRASSALEKAVGCFRGNGADIERSIIFVTDGDTTDVDTRMDLKGARVHCVGLSTAVDHAVLKDLARVSRGSTYWVYPGEDCDTAAREIAAKTAGPLIRDIKLKGLPAGTELVGPKELYADTPITLALKSPSLIGDLTLEGMSPLGQPISLDLNMSDQPTIPFAHAVWTKMKLREGLDADEMTDLSLKYGVLARTTSFVAVLLREKPGSEKPERIEIPVSLPHGWEMEEGWDIGQGMHARAMYAGGPVLRAGIDADLELCCCSLDACCDSGVFDADVEETEDVAIRIGPDLLNDARDLLVGLKDRAFDDRAVREKWSELLAAFEKERLDNFASWEEEHKAELFKILGELRGYGFKVAIPAVLRERPVSDVAQTMWREGFRLIGVQISA